MLPDRSVFDFTDGYSNEYALTGGVSHTMSHCLFMSKYTLNCLYPALCLSVSLVKWAEVFLLGRIESNIGCCAMAERAFVSELAALGSCLVWLSEECSAETWWPAVGGRRCLGENGGGSCEYRGLLQVWSAAYVPVHREQDTLPRN